MVQLAAISIIVPEYDMAIAYFTGCLDMKIIEDRPLTPLKRWVVLAPQLGGGRLVLARAKDHDERQMIGKQGGGRVWLFLETPSFDADYHRFLANGVQFTEAPRKERYGRVVQFKDILGNRWDLIESTAQNSLSQMFDNAPDNKKDIHD